MATLHGSGDNLDVDEIVAGVGGEQVFAPSPPPSYRVRGRTRTRFAEAGTRDSRMRGRGGARDSRIQIHTRKKFFKKKKKFCFLA